MKKPKTSEPSYIKLRREMLEAPGWRALTPAAKCVIERLIIEHMRHAGKDNGRLICTFDDFEEYGIRRKSIAPAIRLAVELGFIHVTQAGWRSAGYRRPAHYRLTFLPTDNAGPTDEWKQVHLDTISPKNKHRKRQLRGAKTPLTPGAKMPPVRLVTGGANAPGGTSKTGGENAPTI
jgi:hypothetical protein